MSDSNYTRPPDSGSTVTMVMIIATTIISLACIVSCTLIAYMFLTNPPW